MVLKSLILCCLEAAVAVVLSYSVGGISPNCNRLTTCLFLTVLGQAQISCLRSLKFRSLLFAFVFLCLKVL